MPNWRYHLRSTILSAVGFGFGFAGGVLLTTLVFDSDSLDQLLTLTDQGRLLIALALMLAVAGLGGGVSGAIAGVTLSYAHQSRRRVGYAWRGALSFGVGYALILIPFTLTVSVISFYDLVDSSPIGLMIPLGILGLIFGGVAGLILGLLTVGCHAWRVFLVGAISFGLGGASLGYNLWSYFFDLLTGGGQAQWALIGGVFAFGAIGGGALGFLYSWLARRKPAPAAPTRFVAWFKRQSAARRTLVVVGLVILFLALRAVWLISPFTAQKAALESVLESNTAGTHWSLPVSLVENGAQPAMTLAGSTAVLAWVQGSDIYYRAGDLQTEPVNVSSSGLPSTAPQIVTDSADNVHLIWVEAGENNTSDILYSRCSASTCAPPERLSNMEELACVIGPSTQNREPSLAIDRVDTLMVTWRSGQNSLPYSTWSGAAGPPETPTGCIPVDIQSDEFIVQQPRLAGGAVGTFGLVFEQLDIEQNGNVYLTRYANGGWSSSPELIGHGSTPEINMDHEQRIYVVWCNPGHGLGFWGSTGETDQIPFPRCMGRPGLVHGSNNVTRLVWYSDEVKNMNGVVQPNALLYESSKTETGWTTPAIIVRAHESTQPVVVADSEDTLHLTWTDSGGGSTKLYYSAHSEYDCSNVELSNTDQAIYNVVRQQKFRPSTDSIPFCQNQYDNLIFAPNPVPAYSNEPPTPNGSFDKFAELARTAEYEVVFATMWYDSFHQGENPGRVLGGAIAELYQNLKDNPSRYPRGLTVRILLGNPPSFAFFPSFNNPVFWAIADLRAAGVPELRNDDIGWNLEIANFSGSWPHSHTKLMVVDGKTVQSVGYNMQHSHLPTDHPSGKGKGRIDIGLQVTGPVAQSSLRAFDDLWQASTQVSCANIDPDLSFWWIFSCQTQRAVAYHVPEVLRYFIPDQGSNAFSIFRTQKFNEGDEAYYQALASATETIDTIHINFSLELICALNILVEACNYANRIEYMDAMMEAIEQNDVKVRVLVSDVAWVGIENNIAIKALENELAARGLSENVEIRYFEQDMHVKSALIDGEFLMVGNQNFHYSAWGSQSGLAEFNLGTGDPEAIHDFQRYFNYYWDRAKKRT